jgi:hypothetical protein
LGTWYASGNVTLQDATSGTVLMAARLWDGSRIIDEAAANIFTTGAVVSLHLSGLISAPVGNLRISARDATTNAGNIVIAASNVSCAGVISAVRVG